MLFNPDRLRFLFHQYATKAATEPEVEELFAAITIPEQKQYLQILIDEEYKDLLQISDTTGIDWDDMFARIIAAGEAPTVSLPQTKRTLYQWRRIAIAASIILVLGLGSYFVFFNNKADQQPVSSIQQPADVQAPQNTKATITLADGRIVTLDSADNGTLATQGNINVIKTADGKIVYETASGEIVKEIKYNTLENPRGSKVIDMTLADGSHVWLNAGSSITYPIAFIGNERKVSITGEAYFEISRSVVASGTKQPGAKQPFIVQKGDMQVQVLGTHFNVNAYDDEADIKVTLMEGSVRVTTASSAVKIKPGEQAVLTPDSRLTTDGPVDLEAVMAWKNGKFQFSDASIETIMKEIARWYDAEIVYEGKIPGNFVADISRDVPVSKLLHILELTNRVHFKIEGKKVTVMK